MTHLSHRQGDWASISEEQQVIEKKKVDFGIADVCRANSGNSGNTHVSADRSDRLIESLCLAGCVPEVGRRVDAR